MLSYVPHLEISGLSNVLQRPTVVFHSFSFYHLESPYTLVQI